MLLLLCLAVLVGSLAQFFDPLAGRVAGVILMVPAFFLFLNRLISWLENKSIPIGEERFASQFSRSNPSPEQSDSSSRLSKSNSALTSPFRRAVFTAIVLSIWLGIPLSLVRLQLDVSQYSFLNLAIGVWFASAILDLFPVTGIIAGITGLLSRDRLVSFLVGVLPKLAFLALGIGFAGPSSEEFGFPLGYALWTSILGLCYGFIGVGGALYGTWEREPVRVGQRTMRRGVLFVFFGFYFWFIVAWGNVLGFPRL